MNSSRESSSEYINRLKVLSGILTEQGEFDDEFDDEIYAVNLERKAEFDMVCNTIIRSLADVGIDAVLAGMYENEEKNAISSLNDVPTDIEFHVELSRGVSRNEIDDALAKNFKDTNHKVECISAHKRRDEYSVYFRITPKD